LATLQQSLLTPENTPVPGLVADVRTLVDNEIGSKGITAAPLKAAYKAVNAFAPGYYESAVANMLPGMIYQLEPYWADFATSGGAGFGDYLAKRGPEVAESLMAVTDAMARDSGRAAVVKAYQLVRGSGAKNIEPALPALGTLVQKYAG
jgi:hypothetical protein